MKYIKRFFFSLLAAGLLFSCQSNDQNPPADDDVIKDDDPVTAKPLPTFLFISDVHLNSEKKEITSESGGYCDGIYYSDTGTDLWDYTKTKLKEVLSGPDKPNFILCTGDFPAHNESINDPTNIPSDLHTVFSDLREIAQANCTPFVYAPGNNDGLGGDYHSFEDAANQPPFVTDSGYATEWPAIVDSSAACSGVDFEIADSSLIDMGYYSAFPLGKAANLRVISLNTVIFTTKSYVNDHGPNQYTAAFDELDWLKGQLKEACTRNERVILMMHIPPGNDYKNNPNWVTASKDGKTINQHFLTMVGDHSDCISGVIYGHTHKDELKLLMDSTGGMSEVAISCPGITPGHCNNAGFKLVSYQPGTFEFMGFTTIWSDFFTTKTAQPYDQTYTFSQYYQKPAGTTMYHHLDSLNDADSVLIETGMGETYNVRNGEGLNDTEKAAIWARYQ